MPCAVVDRERHGCQQQQRSPVVGRIGALGGRATRGHEDEDEPARARPKESRPARSTPCRASRPSQGGGSMGAGVVAASVEPVPSRPSAFWPSQTTSPRSAQVWPGAGLTAAAAHRLEPALAPHRGAGDRPVRLACAQREVHRLVRVDRPDAEVAGNRAVDGAAIGAGDLDHVGADRRAAEAHEAQSPAAVASRPTIVVRPPIHDRRVPSGRSARSTRRRRRSTSRPPSARRGSAARAPARRPRARRCGARARRAHRAQERVRVAGATRAALAAHRRADALGAGARHLGQGDAVRAGALALARRS